VRKLLDLSAVSFLVVDDSPHMRAIVKQILRSFGARTIEEAGDGAGALAAMRRLIPDIVITNWMMAPVDGIALTRKLRRDPDSPCPMVPIIMITGHTEEARVAEARDAGVTEFLAKPMSPRALYLRIEEVILRPREFVRTDDYVGPARERHGDDSVADAPEHSETAA
jgi:two-component system chemotaxis response regulator CheY